MSQISRLRDAEISNGNLINADDIDAELNGLVSESNSQDARLTTLESEDYTQSGNVTFSNAPKTNILSERTADSGVMVDAVLLKDGYIKPIATTQPYTPAVDGEFGYDSTNKLYKGMINSSVVSFSTIGGYAGVLSKSASYTAVAADQAYLINCTSTFTLSLTAAATLGSAWYCYVRNDGTGIITIDPNSTETIDGQTTITMYPRETIMLVCDGSNFKALGRQRGLILLQTQTASNVSSVDFTSYIGSDFDEYRLVGNGAVPATNGVLPYLRTSTDGGSTWDSGASTYQWSLTAVESSTVSSSTGDTKIPFLLSSPGISNSAGSSLRFEARIASPSSTSLYKVFDIESAAYPASGQPVGAKTTGIRSTTSAVNGIRFLFSSGNISSGTFSLYGVRK